MGTITYDEVMFTHGLEWSCAETPLTPDNLNILVQVTVRCARPYGPTITMGLPCPLLSAFENSHTSYSDLQQTLRRGCTGDLQDKHTSTQESSGIP